MIQLWLREASLCIWLALGSKTFPYERLCDYFVTTFFCWIKYSSVLNAKKDKGLNCYYHCRVLNTWLHCITLGFVYAITRTRSEYFLGKCPLLILTQDHVDYFSSHYSEDNAMESECQKYMLERLFFIWYATAHFVTECSGLKPETHHSGDQR